MLVVLFVCSFVRDNPAEACPRDGARGHGWHSGPAGHHHLLPHDEVINHVLDGGCFILGIFQMFVFVFECALTEKLSHPDRHFLPIILLYFYFLFLFNFFYFFYFFFQVYFSFFHSFFLQ